MLNIPRLNNKIMIVTFSFLFSTRFLLYATFSRLFSRTKYVDLVLLMKLSLAICARGTVAML